MQPLELENNNTIAGARILMGGTEGIEARLPTSYDALRLAGRSIITKSDWGSRCGSEHNRAFLRLVVRWEIMWDIMERLMLGMSPQSQWVSARRASAEVLFRLREERHGLASPPRPVMESVFSWVWILEGLTEPDEGTK